jgi:hypothetical protein
MPGREAAGFFPQRDSSSDEIKRTGYTPLKNPARRVGCWRVPRQNSFAEAAFKKNPT